MFLPRVSISRPVFAWMLFAAALVFGGLSFTRLGLSQLPDVDFPVVTVRFALQGASPEVMEKEVIDIAEEALIGVEGVKEMRSSSGQGSASVTLEFDLGRDIDAVVQEVQAKLGQVARRLPSDLDPPNVSKTNPEDQPIIWVAVSGPADKPVKDLMLLVRDQLRDEFQTVPGVSEIFLGGFVDRNLRVWIDPARLDRLQLSVDDVLNTVGREHLEVPAGRLESSTSEINVRFLGEAPSVKAFGDLPIASRGGAPVYRRVALREVAVLEDGLDDVRRISRFNGRPAVGIGIRKMRGVNTVEVGRAVKERVEKVRPGLPQGYEMTVSVDNTIFIEEAVGELKQTLLLAAVLTALVIWIFLGSLSSTFNVLLSIPFSIIGTFAAIYFFGFTLNTFTLLALSLAVGVVVDDAIMVLENIVRHKDMGKPRRQAALDGASEIAFAAMTATFAIVAIFLPVAFMDGVIGRYFFQFAITITVAALLSLIEAMTLTPMRTSQFLEEEKRDGWMERLFERGRRDYTAALGVVLNHRLKVLAGAGLVFVGGIFVLMNLKKEMLPTQDQSRFLLRLSLPTGSSLGVTDEMTKRVEAWLSSRDEVLRYYVAVGGFGGGDVNTAVVFTTLKPRAQRPVVQEKIGQGDNARDVSKRLSQQEFAAVTRRELAKLDPKLRVSVQDLSQRGFSTGRGYPVEFSVRGPDWDVVIAKSEELQAALKAEGSLVDVDSDYRAGQRDLRVVPDREAAARLGVSMQNLGSVISTLVGGRVAGKFSEGGRRNDVRVRLSQDARAKPEDILKINVRNNRGELVRLDKLVKLEAAPSLQAIRRVNRERAITLYANAAPGIAAQQALEAAMGVARQVLPDGYRAVVTGSSQAAEQTTTQLWGALLLGILVSYMILASQFNSFLHPLSVLVPIFFSFTGALGALMLFGQTFNIYSGIGLILLMGLVKKNSILLVDVTNQFRAKGLAATEALKAACPLRLRPIIMTSTTTIAGAVPAAASLGAGAETLRPMGIAIIGGMLVSTVLTLFVVPVAYSLLARLERRPPVALAVEGVPAAKGLSRKRKRV